MGQMTVSKHIAAPQDAVFAIITDLEGAEARITGIKKVELLTDGPLGVGTRWRETRTMFKRDATEEMEIAAFDPPNSYTTTAESCGCTYRTEMRCAPVEGGTELSMTMGWKANSIGAKLMSWMGFLMKGVMKKCIEQDLADIKAHAEAAAP